MVSLAGRRRTGEVGDLIVYGVRHVGGEPLERLDGDIDTTCCTAGAPGADALPSRAAWVG